MPQFSVTEIAVLLGVSDDTVRRWIDSGELVSERRGSRWFVDGASAARLATARARALADHSPVGRSARNRFVGIVTAVTSDTVMSQVEMLCGNTLVQALVSTESVAELGLEPGSPAVAVFKATQVTVERPTRR